MNKIIYIGELALNIDLCREGTTTRVGDRIVCAAMLDGLMGADTLFVGEAAADVVGDHIITCLSEAKVDTKCVDRFTEGATTVRITSADKPDTAAVNHSSTPTEPINPLWPRIDEGDVVVYGSYITLDPRNHDALFDLLRHAKARKAVLVYVPTFDTARVPRMTRVMPAIFDCLELADMVISTTDDMAAIFPGEEPASAFHDHVLFYCRQCMLADYKALQLRYFDGNRSWTTACHPTTNTPDRWAAGIIAGTARGLADGMRDPDDLMERANETAHSEIAGTVQ